MEDTEIRGCFIPKGDTVMTIQASANRDEDAFEDGENYNGLREPNRPPGRRYCRHRPMTRHRAAHRGPRIGRGAAAYPELTVSGAPHNIVVATIGNLVGGSLMVGTVCSFFCADALSSGIVRVIW
jgi:hypothetical protein